MKDAHVTLYDVAARAGVSASTASRALAGLAVRKSSRAAVEKAAAELGYVPNEAARSLRVVRTMTVGMVFDRLTSRLGLELLDGLSTGLDQMGYSLFISTAQGDPERYDQLVRRFLERRVDALVCVHGHGDGAALDRYVAAGIPALSLISRRGGYERLPLISPRTQSAARACVAELRALGHRRVALLAPVRAGHLFEDVRTAAHEGGLEVVDIAVGAGGPAIPDALAASGAQAVIAMQGDAMRILEVGAAQFSVVAIRDRSLVETSAAASLATIHVEPSRISAVAADALRRWLDDKTPPDSHVRVDAGVWRPGASIRPARA